MLHDLFTMQNILCISVRISHVEHKNECYAYIMYDKTTCSDLLM